MTDNIDVSGSVGSISVDSVTGYEGAGGITVNGVVNGVVDIGGNVGVSQSDTAI